MGASGPAIFSDDVAADVRAGWREALMDGLSGDAATERVLTEFADALADEDDATVVWLGLAAAQMQTGRLQDAVRDRALRIIEDGGDVDRWREESAALGRGRERALRTLAEQLRGPQPRPKTLRRPKPRASPLDTGDVVRLRGTRTGEALFVVVDQADTYPPGSTSPVLAALLWEGGDVPDDLTLAHLPILHDAEAPPFNPDKAPPPRQLLHVVQSPARGKHALAHFGEVVAKGIDRPDAADHREDDRRDGPRVDYCGWAFLANWIGESWYDRCVDVTRRMAVEAK
jgi:hypothetical protein